MSSISLAQNGTPRLFYWLLQQRFTGLVHLQDLVNRPNAKIYVHEGRPWYTDLSHPASLLGEMLLRSGKLTQDQLHQSLMQMAQSGQLLGHILVAKRLLDAQTLGLALQTQCFEKLLSLFANDQGIAQVQAQPQLQGLKAGLTQGINGLQLVVQGIRRHWDEARMGQVWGQSRGQTLRCTTTFAKYRKHFGLNTQEEQAATTLDQGWVIGGPGASLCQTQVAFALWNCQMLESVAASATTAPAPSAPVQPTPAKRPATQKSVAPQVPTARSKRPQTNVPIRPQDHRKRKTSTRLPKIPTSMVPPQAANQSESPTKDPRAREVFIANLETYEALIARERHAFALFDLPLNATRVDVRKQWNRLSKDFHPDALPKLGLEHLHARSQRVFAHLSNAYQILGNKTRRNALKTELESGIAPGQDTTDFVRQSLESEAMTKDAERMLKKHQYQRAKELFEKANELRKDQGEVLAGLAWCEYHLSGRNEQASREAIRQLKTISQAHDKCANAFYYLGLVLVATRERNAASRAFKEALEVNPRLLDAQRQLRALAVNPGPSAAKPKKKKLFGR